MLLFNPIFTVFLESTPFPWHYAQPSYTFCVLKFIGLFHSRKQDKGYIKHHNLFSRRTVTLVVSISFSSLWNLLEVMFMHFSIMIYTLVFHHWLAIPHDIRIHCMWYLLHMLDTCSVFPLLPIKLVLPSSQGFLPLMISNWPLIICFLPGVSGSCCVHIFKISAIILCLYSSVWTHIINPQLLFPISYRNVSKL